MDTVTRVEIADSVVGLFGPHPVTADDVAEYAADHGARESVVAVLGRLSQAEYRTLRDLWGELADVPIES